MCFYFSLLYFSHTKQGISKGNFQNGMKRNFVSNEKDWNKEILDKHLLFLSIEALT
jgi:hypothetical protein